MLRWVPLQSSTLTAAAYDKGDGLLYLRFRSGEVYCYSEYPEEMYRQLLSADSKGQFFGRHIRDQFAFRRLASARGASSGSL